MGSFSQQWVTDRAAYLPSRFSDTAEIYRLMVSVMVLGFTDTPMAMYMKVGKFRASSFNFPRINFDFGMYSGNFYQGMKHGVGIFTAASGVCYEGEFVNGKANGRGVCVYPTGDRYEVRVMGPIFILVDEN
jgi:hypothetical protein